jgi:hypothetical protein
MVGAMDSRPANRNLQRISKPKDFKDDPLVIAYRDNTAGLLP